MRHIDRVKVLSLGLDRHGKTRITMTYLVHKCAIPFVEFDLLVQFQHLIQLGFCIQINLPSDSHVLDRLRFVG